MKKFILTFAAFIVLAVTSTSCLDTKDNDYEEWKTENDNYVDQMEAKMENGEPYYSRVVPSWANGLFVLMRWHNDRALTEKNLRPLFNSICDVKYHLTDITGEGVDSSYNQKTNGDSIYRCLPSNQVLGFAVALTNMHIGDSVQLIIPYNAGYGNNKRANMKPYTTLIYELKLVDIPAYETPY